MPAFYRSVTPSELAFHLYSDPGDTGDQIIDSNCRCVISDDDHADLVPDKVGLLQLGDSIEEWIFRQCVEDKRIGEAKVQGVVSILSWN